MFEGAVVQQPDTQFHYDEHRSIAVGMLNAAVVLVVHVESNEIIRIISMRRATRNETNFYYENIANY